MNISSEELTGMWIGNLEHKTLVQGKRGRWDNYKNYPSTTHVVSLLLLKVRDENQSSQNNRTVGFYVLEIVRKKVCEHIMSYT